MSNEKLAYGGEVFDFDGLEFQLGMDGTLYFSSVIHEKVVIGKMESQNADGSCKRAFIPKRKNFRSLLKWAIRDGEYDKELKEIKEYRKEQRRIRIELQKGSKAALAKADGE